jgi:hypothetical protein
LLYHTAKGPLPCGIPLPANHLFLKKIISILLFLLLMFISQLVLYFVDYLLVLLNTMCILLARGWRGGTLRPWEETGEKKRAGGKGREKKGGKKRAGGKGREEKGGKTRQRAGGKGLSAG